MSDPHPHHPTRDVAAGDRAARDRPHEGYAPGEPGYPEHPELEPKLAPDHLTAGSSFRDRFWLSLLLTLIWGSMLQRALGYTAPSFPGAAWIPAVFGTAVLLYGGAPFFQGAVSEIRDRLFGTMTLIALALSVTFAFSAAVALGFSGRPLWEELATLVTVMLLGHWLEMRSISQVQGDLTELAELPPSTATRTTGAAGAAGEDGEDAAERIQDVPLRDVPLRDVPLQAVSLADPQDGARAVRVEVAGTGDRPALAGIMRLIEQAQSSRSRAVAFADRAAFWLAWIALGAAAVTLVVWLVVGAPAATAIERLVTVLVVASPHALGLAALLVLVITTTLGARSGLFVRDQRGLEEARNLTTVVFDKTGTLTVGEHSEVAVRTLRGLSEDEALRLAAAVERDAEHPVARAIVQSASERGLAVPASSAFEIIPGRGVRATVDGRQLAAGGPHLLASLGLTPAPELQQFARGQGVVYLIALGEGGQAIAALAVSDAVRPESAEAVRLLREARIEVVMMTGDACAVALAVARELGIDTVLAEVRQEDKAAHIERLQREGKRVAMVGDGVDDAPALVAADVGVAIGVGTGAAGEAGDIILARSDLRDVPRIINLSRASHRTMLQNIWWVAGYNVIAIPLAGGILAPWGVVLSPAIGAALMSLSTIIVAINTQRLRQERL